MIVYSKSKESRSLENSECLINGYYIESSILIKFAADMKDERRLFTIFNWILDYFDCLLYFWRSDEAPCMSNEQRSFQPEK